MLKIALVHDLDEWVLGTIGFKTSEILNKNSKTLCITSMNEKDFKENSSNVQAENDIVHFVSPWTYFDNISNISIPCVVTVHHLGTVMTERIKSKAEGIDLICTTNVAAKHIMEKLNPDLPDIFITPYGIDVQVFKKTKTNELRKEYNIPEDHFLIGFSAKPTSNEDSRKGVDRYLEVIEKLSKDLTSPYHLIILGPKKEEGNGWDTSIFPESIRDRITVLGFKPNSDMAKYYSGLNCYLCLSRLEGGPYPVMESMACEVPVISTPVGIVPEIMTHGQNGYVVSHEHFLDETIQSIKNIRNCQDIGPLTSAARETIIKTNEWSTVLQPAHFELLYQTAMDNFKKRPVTSRLKSALKTHWNSIRKGK